MSDFRQTIMEFPIRPDPDLPRATGPAVRPTVQRLALDSFRPQTLDDAVSGGAVDYVQLASGRFVGEGRLNGEVVRDGAVVVLIGESPSATLRA